MVAGFITSGREKKSCYEFTEKLLRRQLMAFSTTTPLSHYTNLQLTDAAADAIWCSSLSERFARTAFGNFDWVRRSLSLFNSFHFTPGSLSRDILKG